MIKAKDWIVFLIHDVPLSELPVPPEHMPFCDRWLKRHTQKSTQDDTALSLIELVERLDRADWPGERMQRADLKWDMHKKPSEPIKSPRLKEKV